MMQEMKSKLIKKPKRTVPLLLVYEIPIILDTQHTREEDMRGGRGLNPTS